MTDGSVLARIVGRESTAASLASRLLARRPGWWSPVAGSSCSGPFTSRRPRTPARPRRAYTRRSSSAARRRWTGLRSSSDQDAIAKLVNGPPTESLLRELEDARATLVAVGTHGYSRASEIVLGGVAGSLLHRAPCSVLITRPPADGAHFPRALTVGVDGSDSAVAALEVARQLADRFHVSLRPITGLGGKDVDLASVTRVASDVEVLDAKPLDALLEAASEVDLLVVGSRGLHGLSALGSVSERVAHRAAISVLVVRSP